MLSNVIYLIKQLLFLHIMEAFMLIVTIVSKL